MNRIARTCRIFLCARQSGEHRDEHLQTRKALVYADVVIPADAGIQFDMPEMQVDTAKVRWIPARAARQE
jgi:hypothetical protein